MRKEGSAAIPKDVDEYLASIPKEQRAALEKLRRTIRSVAPNATEKISYQMPTFTYNGPLVAFAAFKEHCSFFPMNSSLLKKYKDELRPYSLSTGTIRFTIEEPLPVSLVKKFVKIRVKENEARAKARLRKK